MHTNRPLNLVIMEFGSVTRARSHKLSETVVVYASVRKPGFAYRFSYFREREDGMQYHPTSIQSKETLLYPSP